MDDVEPEPQMLPFNIRHTTLRRGARVGELALEGRSLISTPSFIAVTSRGVVPHISPDLLQKHTRIAAVYAALEDFTTKSVRDAHVLKYPPELSAHGSILSGYTSLPSQYFSILGPRRIPSVETPSTNTNNSLAISTSIGFSTLHDEDYNHIIRTLKPDCFTSLIDLVQTERISKKREEKVVDRTHAWLRDIVSENEGRSDNIPLLASLPPVAEEQQRFLLSDLTDEYRFGVSGISVYDTTTVAVIPDAIRYLPVFCLTNFSGPHDLLTAVSLGVDLITTPFVTAASEGGIALTFSFTNTSHLDGSPLGVDLWSTVHATDLSPLTPSCSCYTCSRHHRAYIHHLLQAKEMLAWNLLQIHNFHIMDQFFEHIRISISNDSFEKDHRAFSLAYALEIPQPTGIGPRIRGYHMKSSHAGETKRNAKAYGRLEEYAESESEIVTPILDEEAAVLESQGLGQKV